jgi:hypothetical protein
VIVADTTHYLFGRLYQDLLELHGAAWISRSVRRCRCSLRRAVRDGGTFSDVRELAATAPPARTTRASVHMRAQRPNADFNEKSFNSSVVARWEYRPGSTLFVVWTQGRDQSDRDLGSFDARRDYRNLFGARPENVFLIKAAYWVGR